MSVNLDALADPDLVSLYLATRAQPVFATIVVRHKQPIYRLIVAQVRDADGALDLVQETFVAAHGALARFDTTRSLRAWLARIAINKCRDWARRRRVRNFLSHILPLHATRDVVDDTVNVETAAIGRDTLARTLGAIGRLPAALREPLLLCTVEDLSQAEAAEALGISVKAVETRVRRARAVLSTSA